MIEFVDVIVGLSYGDESKGAVTYELCKSKEYTHVLRTSGGSNAGHTIYHNGIKFATHLIPTGIFHGKKCIIGSGCVVNVKKFFKEVEDLSKILGQGILKNIFIAENAHVVTDEHLEEENSETKIGTTKQGIGPCYRDKYDRKGLRAKDVPALAPYLIDLYEEFYGGRSKIKILCEGAQGFNLDIDWGDYPFVTSSHCTTAGALLNGIPPQKVRKVYGVAKAYDTYVGAKQFQPNKNPEDAIFEQLQAIGQEFGATTGRKRQCNWLDLTKLLKAADINGVTDLVVSKIDILREVNKLNDNLYWCINRGQETTYLNSEDEWKQYIVDDMRKYIPNLNVIWRESPTDSLDNIDYSNQSLIDKWEKSGLLDHVDDNNKLLIAKIYQNQKNALKDLYPFRKDEFNVKKG